MPELPEVETIVYRITQEALTNIRKHAGQAPVVVTLEQHDDTIRRAESQARLLAEVTENVDNRPLRALKGQQHTAALPVVMLTSLDAQDVPARARPSSLNASPACRPSSVNVLL